MVFLETFLSTLSILFLIANPTCTCCHELSASSSSCHLSCYCHSQPYFPCPASHPHGLQSTCPIYSHGFSVYEPHVSLHFLFTFSFIYHQLCPTQLQTTNSKMEKGLFATGLSAALPFCIFRCSNSNFGSSLGSFFCFHSSYLLFFACELELRNIAHCLIFFMSAISTHTGSLFWGEDLIFHSDGLSACCHTQTTLTQSPKLNNLRVILYAKCN